MKTEARIVNWIAAGVIGLCSQPSNASGFAIFVQGASALGEGLASTAHGSNPEAVFFNPALISALGGTQVEAGATLVVPKHDFNSDATGESDKPTVSPSCPRHSTPRTATTIACPWASESSRRSVSAPNGTASGKGAIS